ncbi:hypothetical protein ANN_08122 [Periplaneta americana]|uniref:Uncharacterized protein n=1 Tax=Periplaneta americana TaxID=6978 RepID=A0ABQ8T0K1_PERAM|nr:hypothetical protein ANN_08122 [Periplaneta americana]
MATKSDTKQSHPHGKNLFILNTLRMEPGEHKRIEDVVEELKAEQRRFIVLLPLLCSCTEGRSHLAIPRLSRKSKDNIVYPIFPPAHSPELPISIPPPSGEDCHSKEHLSESSDYPERSLYRRPPEAADSLDRPPWNVVKRRWMASAMAPQADLLREEFRLGLTGFWGNLPKQESSKCVMARCMSSCGYPMSLENSIFLHFRRGVLPKCERSCLASTAFILKITYRYVRSLYYYDSFAVFVRKSEL